MKRIKLQMLVSGLLIIAAGALLVAFNSGVLPEEYKRIVFSWPMLLVALGFSFLFGGMKGIFHGVGLLLVGGIFLLRRMDIGYINGENIWAVVLLTAGILIVVKACFWKKCHSGNDPEKVKECYENHSFARCSYGELRESKHKNHNSADFVERNYIFGSSRERVESQTFKGGEVNCIFGGSVLDLTSAQLADGANYLEVNCVFGGVELHVPSDWSVEIRQTAIFGGFVDRRAKSSFEVNDNRKLILVLTAVFGGGEIKNHA
jgi:predicted membrane protein